MQTADLVGLHCTLFDCFLISFGQIPTEYRRNDPQKKNQSNTANYGKERVATEYRYHQVIKDAAENGSDGVDPLGKDKGNFTHENITEQAAAAAGTHSQKYHKKGIVCVAHCQCGIDADNGKDAKADGIEYVVDAVDAIEFIFKGVFYNTGKGKGENGTPRGKNCINIITEHCRRQSGQQYIANGSSAQGGNDAAENHAEKIQMLLDADHCAGNGKGAGTDKF